MAEYYYQVNIDGTSDKLPFTYFEIFFDKDFKN